MVNSTVIPTAIPTVSRPAQRRSVVVSGDVRAAVDEALERFLEAQRPMIVGHDPALGPLFDVARAAVAGGKRLRPAFAYWAWYGCTGGDSDPAAVLPAIAALELLHGFALVHDDVMDGSDTRRGRPTAHRELSSLHRQQRLRGDADRFGVAAAILVGDLCLTWADQMIAQAVLPAGPRGEARDIYDRMRVATIAGQYLDVYSDHATDWTLPRALRTAQLKTAGYTVTWPLAYGAALAGGAPAAVRDALRRYGDAVGVAFQLRDDLLGVFGEPGVTGKPIGDDQRTAKPTVLLQLTRAAANRRQAETLEVALRTGRTPVVAAVAETTGARRQVEQMIADRVAEARGALHGMALRSRACDALDDLAADAAWRSA